MMTRALTGLVLAAREHRDRQWSLHRESLMLGAARGLW